MKPRVQRLLVLFLACAGFGAGLAAAVWWSGWLPGVRGRAVVERPQITADFTLTTADGAPVRWSELGNRLQLVFFGFTNCPEACPATLAQASEALRGLGDEGAGLRLLLISVDPERDTPAALQAYTQSFAPWVVGLTGDAAQIRAAAAAFSVFYEKVPMSMPGEYMVNHTTSLFLLGPGDEILEILPYGATATEIGTVLRRHL